MNTDDVTNLATYKPDSADTLLQGLSTTAATAAVGAWNALQKDVSAHLALIAQQTLSTSLKLEAKTITAQDADHTFSLLEINLNNVLLEETVVPYLVGQKVLNSVFSVVAAVVKNYTGIALNFGS